MLSWDDLSSGTKTTNEDRVLRIELLVKVFCRKNETILRKLLSGCEKYFAISARYRERVPRWG